MTHLPFDLDLSLNDSCRLPYVNRKLSDNGTRIVSPGIRDQSIGTALHLEKLGKAACPPEGESATATLNPVRLHGLLQHRPPVTRVPLEILSYIFELYLARLEELAPSGVTSQESLCVAQVCTLWREIAESDPRLWASIHFCFSESHASRSKDVQRVRRVLDLYLKRSGALPISLTFTDQRTYHPDTKPLISLLVDRLRMHARRWKRISLQLSGGYFPTLFKFTPCDLSSLEHLSINSNSDVYLTPITFRLNLESAIKLKSFSYNGPGPSLEDRIDLRWESLSEVSFEFSPHYGASFTSYRRFTDLAQCRNITTCSLGIDRPPSRETSRTITLPYLQTLRVRRLSPYAHVSGAIRPLILPQLQTLEIDASNLITRCQRWYARTFSDLLVRSGCSLLHLSIQDVNFTNDELIRCLDLSPALTSLRFIPCPRSHDLTNVIRWLDVSHLVQRRNENRQERAVLPQLQEITLASSVDGCLESASALFRSRVGACARAAGVVALRRAEVIFFDMWHDTEVDRARRLGDRLTRVASFREDLAGWVSESAKESGSEDGLEASLVVDSPYLPQYINVQ